MTGSIASAIVEVLYCTPPRSVIFSPCSSRMDYQVAVLLYIVAGLGTAFGEDLQALRIRVLDYAALPPAILRDFDPPARQLFQQAGIDAELRICRVAADDGACEPLSEEPYLKIVARGPEHGDPMVYGTTVREGQINRFAYVFWHELESAARRQSVPASVLLAHVVAHEVGHLLGLDHAAAGIMRPRFGPPDLLRAVKGRLHFTDREAGRMRQALRQ